MADLEMARAWPGSSRRPFRGSDDAARRPAPGVHDEGCGGDGAAAQLAELVSGRGLEAGYVDARGADAERERLPPVVEAALLDADPQRGLLDLAQAGVIEQLR